MVTKKRIIAVACALALGVSGSALATIVNVDGVTWDSSSQFDLTIQSLNLRESAVGKVGDVLTGYGQIGSINGNNGFCQGCDLTFTFQYTVSNITGNHVVFDNGSFQFYVDPTKSFQFGDPSSASIGTPWVSMTGHTAPNAAFAAVGQLYATISGTILVPTNGSNGIGLVDVGTGPAAPWLNSDSIPDGIGGFADFNLNSSFLNFPAKGCESGSTDPTNVCHFPIEGNGSLTGMTVLPATVPEPGELGLLGLGLGILGFLFQRRRKEAAGRA